MGAEEAQNALLQKLAAAAMPHRLGSLYSRYGEPAPVLGRDRPVLSAGSRAVNALGAAGRPESSQQTTEDDAAARRADDEAFARYEDLGDPEDVERSNAENAGENRDMIVRAYGGSTPGLEDLLDSDPNLTVGDIRQFVRDSQRSGIGWEDWRDQHQAEGTP